MARPSDATDGPEEGRAADQRFFRPPTHSLPLQCGFGHIDGVPGTSRAAGRAVAPTLAAASERDAVAWSAVGGGIVAAVGMTTVAIVANGRNPDADDIAVVVDYKIGTVILGAFVLAAVGAAVGAIRGAREVAPARARTTIPPQASVAGRLLTAPARGFAILLAAAAVLTVVHSVAAIIDGARTTEGAGVPTSLVETALYSADFGVNSAGLGAFAQFEGEPGILVSPDREDELRSALDEDDGKGRILDLDEGLPTVWFLLLLVGLVGTVVLVSLYTGFATARAAIAGTQVSAAAFGALTGVVFAAGLVVLRAASGFESVIGTSLFGMVLLVAGIAGAVGGVLSVGPTPSDTPSAAPPTGSAGIA